MGLCSRVGFTYKNIDAIDKKKLFNDLSFYWPKIVYNLLHSKMSNDTVVVSCKTINYEFI